MRPDRIPLFPLDVVLFPAMPLPLHIFEPRYKIMIARCLNEHLEFGIVFDEEKSVSRVGSTAEIVRKIKDYPDGRMDILTRGRAIFRLLEVLEEKEYYEARVEYLTETSSQQDERAEAALIEAFQRCMEAVYGKPGSKPAPATQPEGIVRSLVYAMAPHLPLSLQERQSLLEMRDESARRQFLARWFGESLPKLVEHKRVRARAGGNGHRPN